MDTYFVILEFHLQAGIKMHTLYEIQTDIPTFIHITEAKEHDQRAMEEIPYETRTRHLST